MKIFTLLMVTIMTVCMTNCAQLKPINTTAEVEQELQGYMWIVTYPEDESSPAMSYPIFICTDGDIKDISGHVIGKLLGENRLQVQDFIFVIKGSTASHYYGEYNILDVELNFEMEKINLSYLVERLIKLGFK